MARPGLTGHRKFRRLARALGSQITARGVLELLWDSCYESGEDYVGTADDIETMVAWTGEHGALAAALVDAGAPEGYGFIEPIDDTASGPVRFRVHDLWHHAPDYVAKRRRRELDRLAKVDPSTERRRSAPTSDWQNGDGRTPSPSSSPSPSPSPSPKSVSSAAPSAPAKPSSPSVLIFPVVGKGGPGWNLTDAQVSEWLELYPGVDILAEARHALAWVKANTGRRKTAAGMPRFLVNWFSRTVNRGGRSQTRSAPVHRASQFAQPGPSDRDLELIAQYERTKAIS